MRFNPSTAIETFLMISNYSRAIIIGLLSSASMGSVASPAHAHAFPGTASFHAALSAPARPIPAIEIPWARFQLENGLTVIVHEDRSAPVVAVQVWYGAGSKHDPLNSKGLAHLFEHLMFEGTSDQGLAYVDALKSAGGTSITATTWFDRTMYTQLVPKSSLEYALYLESNRMGYKLENISQISLSQQRGVVQNEQRQSDNAIFGLAMYASLEALLPDNHPYRHSPLGSMTDLNDLSVDDLRNFYHNYYSPSNAYLVLSGDVDLDSAKSLVQSYFGDIKQRSAPEALSISIPSLSSPKTDVLHDQGTSIRISKEWVTPNKTHPDTVPLNIAAAILADISGARLSQATKPDDRFVATATSSNRNFHDLSFFDYTITAAAGSDHEELSRRADELFQNLILNGPTQDEIDRAVSIHVFNTLNRLETVSGRAAALAEGQIDLGDPQFYQNRLQEYVALTPLKVQQAMSRWLTRPAYTQYILPGEREPYIQVDAAPIGAAEPEEPSIESNIRRRPPILGEIEKINFPDVQQITLTNGLKVFYVHSVATPVSHLVVDFDAGRTVDSSNKIGLHAFMLEALAEGTANHNSDSLKAEQERNGADISISTSMTKTSFAIKSLSDNFDRNISLLSDIIIRPSFDDAAIEQVRDRRSARSISRNTSPVHIANRTLIDEIYGVNHPYNRSFNYSGNIDVINSITRNNIIEDHLTTIRPDNAKIFVVSNLPLSDITNALERTFGHWEPPHQTRIPKPDFEPVARPTAKIVLIDRPQSSQSLIYAGQTLPQLSDAQMLALEVGNSIIGQGFGNRVETELRTKRGWSYHPNATVVNDRPQAYYAINAAVQPDKTGEAMVLLRDLLEDVGNNSPISQSERDIAIGAATRSAAIAYASSNSIISALQENDILKRDYSYQNDLIERIRSLSVDSLNQIFSSTVNPNEFVWIVVGDANTVRPQLDALGLPIEVRPLP